MNVLNKERIRPSWDNYFIELANLASQRSNCMKRRVGCVLVRNNRVVATGYNGTPRNTTNCNEGGCHRCNSNTRGGEGLDYCLCLHAEENAILEAGRERCEGSVLYCSTCPCLFCAKKIIQAGITRVVYSESYAMDSRSESLLKQVDIELIQFKSAPISFVQSSS
jgi:dCMP deaminase